MPNDDPDPDKGKGDDKKPGTGSDTDAEVEKWKALARKHEAQAKANAEAAQKLETLENEGKSEVERLTKRLTEAEKLAAEATARADRFEVALDKGLDMVRAKRLAGTTKEELEADADELKSWTSKGQPAPPGKPTEDLKGGGDPTADPEPDIRKVVEAIPRGF